ncbi:MAG: class I adenylate-forming enzyme family protein [Smithella sp.]
MNKFESSMHATANESPDRLAIQFHNSRLSHSELANALDLLTQYFGRPSGKRIIILLPDSIPSYLCHLHFFISGAIVTPVSIRAVTSRIRLLCDKIKPHFIITNSMLRDRHKSVLESFPCILIKNEEINPARGFEYEAFGLDDILTSGQQSFTGHSNDIRLIAFTSGSTGDPKGVCLSENNILSAAAMMIDFLSLEPSRKSLVTVPLYDYYGFIQIYGHILSQCGFVFGETIGLPDQLFKCIVDEKITDLVLVPYALREMVRRIKESNNNVIKNLKFITSSSDFLTADTISQAFELNPDMKIFNIYGLTEAGRACSKKIDRSSITSNIIGKPSKGVEITIDAPPGEPGEIIIKGPNVMLGYLQDIENDEVVYDPCSQVNTGDIGYYDKNGDIILVGRLDQMINIKGSKIHPNEIESLALQIPGISDAIVRTGTNEKGDIIIIMDIVSIGETTDLNALRAHLRNNLPPYFNPKEINIVPHISRTELGSKILHSKTGK